MDNSIARFQISADEDFRIQFVFVGLSLADRVLRILIKERSSNTLRATLTLGAGLTLDGTDTLTATVAQATAAAWAKGEFETDLHDITGGANTRLVGARTLYDLPGRLPYGVIGAKATVQWAVNKAIVTAIGGIGPSGPANHLTVGDVTTLPAGEPAAVRITGDAPNQEVEFDIPKGADGTDGDDGLDGDKGWSPLFSGEDDGARRVLRFVDWAGGEGTKPAVGGYIGPTGLVADIVDAMDFRGAPGAGASPGSIGTPELADKAATFAKMQDIATARLLGRNSAGTGSIEELTIAVVKAMLGITTPGNDLITAATKADQRSALQITTAGEAMILATTTAIQTALLNALVGDGGAGGTKGLVPAPAAGDAAAGKVLGAGGGWVVPGGGGSYKGERGAIGAANKGDIFRVTEQQLDSDVTIAATENASAPGPLTIATGVTLTVSAGGNLVIL